MSSQNGNVTEGQGHISDERSQRKAVEHKQASGAIRTLGQFSDSIVENVNVWLNVYDTQLNPRRLLTHARPTGSAAGVLPDLEPMLEEYYQLRGWTAEGVPTEGKLHDLGLA